MAEWLGEFEQVVLFAVAQVDDAYGTSIREEIERRTGRHVMTGVTRRSLTRFRILA